MNATQAIAKLADVVRRKHFSLSTEASYCGWLKRYCAFLKTLPVQLPSEQKLERFLTALARNDVAASTQNQAFNAILCFHAVNVQRAVRNACRQAGVSILPHELRHAYATHCLNRGANPRAIQAVMGHKSLETTMAYLHAEAVGVQSPLDAVA